MIMLSRAVLLLTQLFLLSCDTDIPKKETHPPFASRQTISLIENEVARLKFHCEDTGFAYIQLENADSVVLIVDDSTQLQSFLFKVGFDASLLPRHSCELAQQMDMSLQDPELKISVSGQVKEFLPDEKPFGFPTAKAFVIDSLFKLNDCPVEAEIANETFSLQETAWRVVDVETVSGTFYPACEYNDVRIIFTEDSISTDVDDEFYGYKHVHIATGANACSYSFKKVADNQLMFKQLSCTLEFIESTYDVITFHDELLSIINIEYDSMESASPVSYTMQNNLLTLINPETNAEVRLYAETN